MILPENKFSFYLQGTNGKGVVLIHGLTGIPAEMKLVARGLHRASYSVYAPLLAGHGADVKTLVKTKWQDWLKSVENAANLLKNQGLEVYSAGICVGGKLGMLAAQKMPETIKATAIYSPCFRYDGWNVPFYYPILSRNIGWLSRIKLLNNLNFSETSTLGVKNARLRKAMESLNSEGMIDEFPAKGLVEMYMLGNELKKQLPSIKTPALILHAREDDLSNPRNAEIIANNIGGEYKLDFIEDSYHMIHMDTNNKNVTNLTAEFFNNH